MAQTKRKRRTKHRGNAAGMVEARGRTSRTVKLTPAEERKRKQQERMLRKPTWKSAATKAGVMSAVLFMLVVLGVLGKNMSTASGVIFALAALVIYTPLAYATDKWVYRRQLNKQAGAKR